MEKALTKVTSFKVGGSWISKKAKEELSNITNDLTTFSSTVEEKAKWVFNKLKGKPLKSLPDLLKEYNLPAGLFPENIICYEFDETKNKLTVFFSSLCEVTFQDGSAIRYATRVKGILLRGKLMGVEGMKTKVLVWVKVTTISVESSKSDKLWFTAGVKKSRSKNVYDTPHDAIKVVGEF
ncbi:hypothetical protein AALP_AA5G022200 [Arabis alpina]|uniref:DUF538 family protein n=1 Tax=Arabis alpina TaxID=50452 RepID=A0A087GUF8_ARAAL|nr:hypothetical protein AALP_AA5G022200 [Arabis alpina]